MPSRCDKVATMRFVVVGAGAIGGVLGARLHQHGHDVALVARGAHHDAIRDHGLRLVAPDESVVLPIPVFPTSAAVGITDDDVVLLCVKAQDTVEVLNDLVRVAPDVPIVCAQNGVVNEREALRRFADVYGVCVMCPAVHLEPGVVEANAAPVTGILDLGRIPHGVDDRAEAIAAAFSGSTYASVARPDIMRWKYGKLLNNLANALDALFGREVRGSELGQRTRAEGEAVLAAAGIDAVGRDEDAERRGDLLPLGSRAATERLGSSSWQSLARGTGAIEADYLNGEVVLLGRLHGVPTPVNAALQRLANDAARRGVEPRSLSPDVLIRVLDEAS
jgi:2-dehydropantoate 2-reductase